MSGRKDELEQRVKDLEFQLSQERKAIEVLRRQYDEAMDKNSRLYREASEAAQKLKNGEDDMKEARKILDGVSALGRAFMGPMPFMALTGKYPWGFGR